MPPKGRVGSGGHLETVTAAEQEFARALKATYEQLKPASLADNAKRLYSTGPGLSHFLNGHRVPSGDMVERLYSAALLDAGPDVLPHGLDRLLQLRDSAAFARAAGRAEAGRSASAMLPPAGAVRVPVPRRQLDRQPMRRQIPRWEPIDELQAYLVAGRKQDALALLAHIGRSFLADEVCTALDACMSAGLADAAEAILHSASLRPPESALLIARALARAGMYDELNKLLHLLDV